METPNTFSSPLFLESAREIVARVSAFSGPEAADLLREADTLIKELEDWKSVDADGRVVIIQRLFDLNRRSLEFLSHQGPISRSRPKMTTNPALLLEDDADDDDAIAAGHRKA